jgi:hypothetical protein
VQALLLLKVFEIDQERSAHQDQLLLCSRAHRERDVKLVHLGRHLCAAIEDLRRARVSMSHPHRAVRVPARASMRGYEEPHDASQRMMSAAAAQELTFWILPDVGWPAESVISKSTDPQQGQQMPG